ncbi:PadR family transcriptional regulator [Lacrimispora sp.]|jgi:DNA-binding PadR family transcriptional regulator|uniref:PadR family transcriptional regulator n=1 Tax=Lacrimispora sp. TaxID=2719234 RepID=UPI0028AD1266|nr:PadR family transcriptional regulator [Lacrimispora sp.]
MIPLYILGLLQRFGPQHGYQIKKIIAEQLSDFTQIKLPTIYYHLEKMETDDLLSANREKPGGRPEKTIYTITDKGMVAFKKMIAGLVEFEYRPTFPSDGVFYFSDYIENTEILSHLTAYIHKLNTAISNIEKHREETMHFVPEEDWTMVNIIFSHHEHHYRAELDWAEESLNRLSL